MLWDKFKYKLDKYIYENWTFRIVTLVLLGIIVFQQYMMSSKLNSQRTVFVPPTVSMKEFWVMGDQISKEGLEDTGKFVAYNIFNVTKEIAPKNIDNIMALVPPEYYYEVKTSLIEQMEYVTSNGIARSFYPSMIDAKEKGLIKISGVLKDTISDKVVNSKRMVFEIQYQIVQGRFWLHGWNIDEEGKGKINTRGQK